MQQIPLSRGMSAVLDDEDFNRLSQYHWCYRPEREGKLGYAIRHASAGGTTRTVYLHRQVMGPVPVGHEVIFLNHDRLDCRRCNLRVVTTQDARRHHRVARSNSKSGLKGVRFNPDNESWSASLCRNGHQYHIGTYASPEQAVAAYEEALRHENPELHTAPQTVERQRDPAPVPRDNPMHEVGHE